MEVYGDIMYKNDLIKINESALKKEKLLNENFFGFFISSLLAGLYIGFGVLIAYSVGSFLHDFSAYKLIMGICFSAALSFVYFAGAELFTGNVFIMSAGYINKKINFKTFLKSLVVCYLGNFIGALLLALLVILANTLSSDTGYFIAEYANTKISLSPISILIRGIFCNILVCLATWCGYKMQSESGKLIMIFWCIVTFFTLGFEHSIANMSLLLIGTINNYDFANSALGVLYNLSLATIGNIIGGMFLAICYIAISKKDK